jgi:uncharacterized membrane protein
MKKENLLSEVVFEKKRHDLVANYLTTYFGSIWFLYALALLVLGWVLINGEFFYGIIPLDPYPFIFLVMTIQMFEVFLTIIILISQNRQGKMSEVRQQIDLEVNVRAENEITKILHMVEELHTRLGISRKDNELEQMKVQTDIEEIKEKVELVIEAEQKMLVEVEKLND